ncbi:hypothetical protein ACOJVU_16530 [Mycobacterium sp. THU-M104]|uniref:hypothetical protein n=1 Tax=Mycobacterium sp. THU-M104 TaxID=3410515 RepID=UPI003B9A3ABD
MPGGIGGAVVRVFLIPGPGLFRLAVAVPLLPLGLWLCLPKRTQRQPRRRTRGGPSHRSITAPAAVVGVVGGLIGGYPGARLQPSVPEPLLRAVLGVSAIATAALYVVR